MANSHETLTGLFTDIADAIRSKSGGTGAIVADQFPEAIAGISVGVDTSDATASAGEILYGETAYVNGAKVTGSMANNGAVSQAINAGGSYTIPAGYHNGSGKVTGNSLASQTSADAAAGDITSGKTAWVNGAKVTGTMSGVYKKVATISLQYDMQTRSGVGGNSSISYYFGTTLNMLDIIVCDKYPYIIGHVGNSGGSGYVHIVNNDSRDRALQALDTFSVYRKS